uniref:Cathepsin L n=1 Tax=Aceria tosichella TaxID=561515 RepID=A0A6G1SDA4_9ACAR
MKFIILLSTVCLASIGELVLARHSNLHEWVQYKKVHGKVYEAPEEDSQRFSLFLAAKEQIRKHNAKPEASYRLALNHLSDLTPEEAAKSKGFIYDPVKHMKRLGASKYDPFLQEILADPAPVPDEIDWRKVPGRVTTVKNQGGCASCWAFSTTGLLEGQQVVRNITKQLVSLSEQDLVDCSQSDYGCGGGDMDSALADIEKMGGIESEKDYPYKFGEARSLGDDECHFKKSKAVMTDSGSVDLPENDHDVIRATVAKYGPVAIALEANESFRAYSSGIFDDPKCGTALDHAVLIVGYGKCPKHGDYYIVKNSWGENWGERGYIRIKPGVCGVGSVAIISKF